MFKQKLIYFTFMKKEISIIGSGTYGEVIFELAVLLGYEVSAFYDDNKSKHGEVINSVPIFGAIDLHKIDIDGKNFVVAIGANDVRTKFSKQIIDRGGKLPTLIHPSAIVSSSAKIGKGCILHANSFVWTNVVIEDYSIISVNSNVAHHSILRQGCFVSTGCNIGASMELGKNSFIGMGATLMTGIESVGEWSIVGAGSVVIRNVPEFATVAGNPAKTIKITDQHD